MPAKIFFDRPLFAGSAFSVRGIGYHEPMPPCFVNRPQGAGDWLLMYFHTPVRCGCGPDAPAHETGVLFLWPPDEYQYYGQDAPFDHSWMHCSGRSVLRWLEGSGLPLRTAISLPAPERFLRLLEDLYAELALQAQPDEIIAGNLFENWARDLGRSLAIGAAPAPERLRAVREFMDAHCAQSMRLADLARRAHLSVSQFSSQFRRHFGSSPVDYVIRQRLRLARYLLRDVNLSIGDVARRVGYDDVYHFSRLFRKHCGCPPSVLRERMLSGSASDTGNESSS